MNPKERLEEQLLAAYDAKYPLPRARPRWRRYALAAAGVAFMLTISRAPASYQVEVGKQVEILLPEDAELPTLAESLPARLRAAGLRLDSVRVRMSRKTGAPPRLTLDAWGTGLDGDALVRSLRAEPGLSAARFMVTSLSGPIRDTLAGKVRHKLFPASASPEERERARQALILEIQQREGEDAKVDVQVGPDGREVHVRVTKEKPE
jgi:hypothetical protein